MTSMEFVALAAAVLVFVGLVFLAKYIINLCAMESRSVLIRLPLGLSATSLCAKTFRRAEMQVRARPNVAF